MVSPVCMLYCGSKIITGLCGYEVEANNVKILGTEQQYIFTPTIPHGLIGSYHAVFQCVTLISIEVTRENLANSVVVKE